MVGIGSALRDRARNGSSLLEAVVALAIVGMAILAATTALQSHAAMLARSAVREQLLHTAEDVLDFMACGARVVAVGSAGFREPLLGARLATELGEDLAKRGLAIEGLVGCAHASYDAG